MSSQHRRCSSPPDHAVAWARTLGAAQGGARCVRSRRRRRCWRSSPSSRAAGEFDAEVLTPESEHSVMSACIPASAPSGVRVFTASRVAEPAADARAAHCASGARAIVMANINRTVASPWSLLATRPTTWRSDASWISTTWRAPGGARHTVAAGLPRCRSIAAAGAGEPRCVLRLALAQSRWTCRRRPRWMPYLPDYAPPHRLDPAQPGDPGSSVITQDDVLPPPPGHRGGDARRCPRLAAQTDRAEAGASGPQPAVLGATAATTRAWCW